MTIRLRLALVKLVIGLALPVFAQQTNTVPPTRLPSTALRFFGGVTDPGLFSGQYKFSWPDTLLLTLPINMVTCQDSTAEYQCQTGANTFNGVTGLGLKPIGSMLLYCRAHKCQFLWYGGFAAYFSGSSGQYAWYANNAGSGPNIVRWFTNWVIAVSRAYPDIPYINYCNEPLHSSNTNPFPAAFGGAGRTGYDWIINIGKIFRTYFPNARLGVNDFQCESVANDLNTGDTKLPQFINMVNVLKKADVIDWAGWEGYSLQSTSSANFAAAIQEMANTGVPLFLTEFSPEAYLTGVSQATQLADWQRLMGVAINSGEVEGIIGPWTFRKSNTGGVTGDSYWIIDDRANPSSDTGTDTLTSKWLKSYIPTIIPRT